jgi:hypothetical protein
LVCDFGLVRPSCLRPPPVPSMAHAGASFTLPQQHQVSGAWFCNGLWRFCITRSLVVVHPTQKRSSSPACQEECLSGGLHESPRATRQQLPRAFRTKASAASPCTIPCCLLQLNTCNPCGWFGY